MAKPTGCSAHIAKHVDWLENLEQRYFDDGWNIFDFCVVVRHTGSRDSINDACFDVGDGCVGKTCERYCWDRSCRLYLLSCTFWLRSITSGDCNFVMVLRLARLFRLLKMVHKSFAQIMPYLAAQWPTVQLRSIPQLQKLTLTFLTSIPMVSVWSGLLSTLTIV